MYIASVPITHSSVAGSVPGASEVDIGALAVNVTDAVMYTKNYLGSVVRIEGDSGNGTLASASTLGLGAVMGAVVDVSGTTTITAITLREGQTRTVRFTGALTLTHGVSLVLPRSANITTAAGDFATFRGYAAGVVRCMHYSAVAGVNAAQLLGATWAAPLAIGTVTPASGAFTTGSFTSNVGINATPAAWASSYRAMALNHTGTNIYGWSGGNLCGLVTGAYINSGFSWTYGVSSLAINKIELNDSGNVTIATAPSGTSGNAVTWTNRLTVTSNGVTVKDAFGCNSKTAQTAYAVGSASTDLATVITLANNIRTALINNGIAS